MHNTFIVLFSIFAFAQSFASLLLLANPQVAPNPQRITLIPLDTSLLKSLQSTRRSLVDNSLCSSYAHPSCGTRLIPFFYHSPIIVMVRNTL